MRAASWAALFAVVVVLLLPGLPVAPAAVGHPPPRVGGAGRAPAVPGGAPVGRLSGVDPVGQRGIDVPALALRELRAWQAANPVEPTVTPTSGAAPLPRATEPPRPQAAASAAVTGRVYDVTFGQPIANATVFLTPLLGSCQNATCSVNSTPTATNGSFTLGAPAAAYTLGFGAPLYLANSTWITLTAGRTRSAGILFLVHEGYAEGVVEAAIPGHPPLAGVSVTSLSRDGQLKGNPTVVTATNGSFRVPVPPLPSQINFDPPLPPNASIPSPYLPNETYANVTPYSTVDVGTVYLEGGVAVNATFYDEGTGRPIATDLPSQLSVCHRSPSFCLAPFLDHAGPNVSGWGIPGAASVVAYAIGYVVNSTPLPDLPDTNATVDLGRIYLVPMGAAEVSANVTGGDPSGGVWPAGNVSVAVCTLNGEEVAIQAGPGGPMTMGDCWPTGSAPGVALTFAIGSTTYAPGPPLHDAVILNAVPATDSLPLAYSMVDQYAPRFPTRFSNLTWTNLTAGGVTVVGAIDLLPGTYLQGNVSIPGVRGPLAGDIGSISVCEEGNPLVCADPGVVYGLGGPVPSGCFASNSTFCVPAPPGPDRVTVTGFGGLESNWTWTEVPSGCCAQEGRPTDIGAINLSALGKGWGTVSGSVLSAASRAPLGGFATSIFVCPVGPPPVGRFAPSCQSGSANGTTGAFNLTAPVGWDQVDASAPGYQENWTWVDVTGANTTGALDLTPDAVVGGRVITPDGRGLYGAVVQACEMGSNVNGATCFTLGTTDTFGEYNGTLRGGPLPWGSYELVATAGGFAQNWTWVNTTVNAITLAPPITLWPLGFGGGPARPAAPGTTSVGAWVSGRLVDHRTGYGIPSATVEVCAILTGNCAPAGSTTYGGTFNVSMQTGYYDLTFTPLGYDPTTIFVNGTVPVIDLGAVRDVAYPWVSGRVLLGPWTNLTEVDGVGPSISFFACTGAYLQGICGPQTTTDSGGYFNASVPDPGGYLNGYGNGVFGFGSANGAYAPIVLGVTANTPFVHLPTYGAGAPVVDLFGAVAGTLMDGSAFNASLNASVRPAPFTEVQVEAYGTSFNPFNVMQTGAGGNYVGFIPSGAGETIHGFGATYFTAALSEPPVPSGAMLSVPPIDVPRYGWVTAHFADNVTGAPLAGVPVSVAYLDVVNATPIDMTETSNGAGDVNVSAPPVSAARVAWGLPGYLNNSTSVSVGQARTTGLGRVGLAPGGPSLYGWVQSASLGGAAGPPVATVVDATTHAALPSARVIAIPPFGPSTPTVQTNGLGQFLLYAPAQPGVGISFEMPAYDAQVVTLNLSAGGRTVLPRVNLTGNGIVAGRVVSEPGNLSVGDIQVSVCPAQSPGCPQFTSTNGSGVFWVAASAGSDVVTVISAQYLTNVTRGVNVPSDGFVSVGAIPVYAFGQVSGVVRGIPTGFAVPQANVSICSPLAPLPLGCFVSVRVGPNGSFTLPIPPSTYLLYVTAPYFNASFREISISPGEHLSVGTIFLVSYGVVTGRAVSVLGGAAVANATVIVCSLTPGVGCSARANGSADGAFVVVAPPGPGDLTVSAPGFLDNFSAVSVPAGGTLDLGSVDLVPIGPAVPETISGRVVSASGLGAAITGAAVTATQNGVSVASASTDGSGAFVLTVYYGSFTLVSSAAGYRSNRTALVVHANVTGLTVSLATMTYSVTGTVTDAATRSPLAGVAIRHGGTLFALSDAGGQFAFAVENGTYALVASATPATVGAYAPLAFSVTVSGASLVRAIALVAAATTVLGSVVDARTGLPIAGAVVTATGAALPGPDHRASATTDALGAFRLLLPSGAYTLNVSAIGYRPFSEGIASPTGAGGLALALSPTAAGPSGPSLTVPLLLGLLAGGLVAGAVVLVLRRRRPPPPPSAPAWAYEIVEPTAPEEGPPV